MIAKSLLVNGSARFLNTLYANDLTVSGTTSFAGLTTSALTVNGNATMSGTLTLTKTQDLSGTANNSPALIVGGAATSTHIEIDANEIHAKASGTTTAPLYINTDGGVVYLSNGSKISASNGTFTTQTLNVNGTTYYFNSSGNINANGITATNANINKGIFHNAVVEGTLYAVHQEIDHVANLGGVFLVTPTVKCISSGSNKTLTSVTVTASSTTRTNSDGESITYNYSLQINDSAFSTASIGGNNWVQYGEVKVSGNINGTVLGTCDGFIQSINTSTHVLTVAIKYNGDQTLATPSDISTVEDLNVMLKTVYDSSQSKHYPVGIWMKSRDANGYSHISLYGGTSVDPTVRIGNLQGCPTINGESPTGWGIFTNNGYFSGLIVSNSGKIGNFTISDALYSTAKAFGTTANNVYIGDDGISLGTTFKVTKAGVLTATSGSIGGWTIGTSDIHSGTHSAWNTASDGLFLGTTKIAGGNGGTWYLNNDGTGKIGRFTFSSGGEFTTTVNSNTAGMGNGTYAFWAGATSANAANAPFRVTYAGAITATSATITGEINATSGTIGGASISNGILQIKNVNIAEQITATNINASGLTIGQSQVTGLSTDLANAQNTANAALGQSVWYATCPTAAATAEKVATISPATTAFTLTPGVTVNVKFDIKNSAGVSTLKLNVNGTGAKSIKYIYNGTLKDIPGATYLNANQMYQFRYDGTYWVVEMIYNTNDDTYNRTRYQAILNAANTITASRIICGTSSGYQNIGASVSFDLTYPLLYAATAIATGATSGTRDNNYLEINGITYSNNGTITSGAANKTIYLKGTVSGNTFTIAASPFLTTVVPSSADGCCYIPLGIMTSATVGYFRSSSELWAYKDGAFGPVSLREASAAAKTATNYLTQISGTTGISVHDSGDTSNFVNMNSNGVFVYKGGTQRAQFADTTIIGKPFVSGASDNESHIEIDYHSFKMADKEGGDFSNYVYFSDLRGTNGITEIHDNFVGDGTTKDFYLSLEPTDTSYTVKVNGTIVTSEVVKFGNAASFNTAPAASSTIEIIYNTTDRRAKSFTLGSRKTNSTIGPMSVAVGYNVAAEGTYSFVEGEENTSSGRSSHAEGRLTEASGDTSHAEGNETMAIASHSHAEGYSTTSSGNSSHSEGVQTTASGYASHAEGSNTKASGDYSHVQNYYTIATESYQTVIGKYNKATVSGSGTSASPYTYTNVGDYAFIIGNGTANTTANRSNALTVDWNGGLEMYLDIDSSANASTAATSGTDKDLFNVIRSLGWVSTVID